MFLWFENLGFTLKVNSLVFDLNTYYRLFTFSQTK